MLRLTSVEKLQAVLASAVAANQPITSVCFSEDGGASYPGGVQKTALNGVTPVDILPAPPAGTRDIDYLSIHNRDTASIKVTIQYNASGAIDPIITTTLATLETLQYTHESGWSSLDANGRMKQGAMAVAGSQGDVQYNNAGSLGAESAFNYNATTDTLSVSKIITSMPSLNGGPFAGLRNKIIGGDFSTNPWQRGTAINPLVNANYMADRWQFVNSSAVAVLNTNRSVNVPTVAQAGRLISNSMIIIVLTPDVTLDAGDVVLTRQAIEGYNWAGLAQRPCILSFWHNHTKAGTYCVAVRNAGGNQSFVAEYVQKVANVWEYEAIVISASPASGTWDYANGIGVYVSFTIMCGATFQTTPGVWQNGEFYATANQVNGVDAANNTVRFALIQLEPGAIATPFEDLPVQKVLQLCQRYYCKSFAQPQAPAANTGINDGEFTWNTIASGATLIASPKIPFPVTMRATPTILLFNPAVANSQVRNLNASADCTSSAAAHFNDSGFVLTCVQHAGATPNQQLHVHWTASAEF